LPARAGPRRDPDAAADGGADGGPADALAGGGRAQQQPRHDGGAGNVRCDHRRLGGGLPRRDRRRPAGAGSGAAGHLASRPAAARGRAAAQPRPGSAAGRLDPGVHERVAAGPAARRGPRDRHGRRPAQQAHRPAARGSQRPTDRPALGAGRPRHPLTSATPGIPPPLTTSPETNPPATTLARDDPTTDEGAPMFSTLSPGALGLDLDHSRAVDLAAAHGFGGVDPDLGRFRALGPAGTAEHAAAVREKGLQWGMAGLPVALDAPAEEFRRQLVDLPSDLELLTAAGVTRVGTWIRPMHQELDHRQNWRLHQGRIALVAALLEDAGLRLGLEYIGPKTFWSTERFPFVHSLREARELIAETGAANVGLILDTYHWYTAGEDASQLEGLTDADIV